jgi:hypothetical protein
MQWINAMMKRYTVAMTEELEAALEKERKRRMLDSIPETMRVIVSEYLSRS